MGHGMFRQVNTCGDHDTTTTTTMTLSPRKDRPIKRQNQCNTKTRDKRDNSQTAPPMAANCDKKTRVSGHVGTFATHACSGLARMSFVQVT